MTSTRRQGLALFVNARCTRAIGSSWRSTTIWRSSPARSANTDQELATRYRISTGCSRPRGTSWTEQRADRASTTSSQATTILQPEPAQRSGDGPALSEPRDNVVNIVAPNQGGIISLPVLPGLTFSNPLRFICSSIRREAAWAAGFGRVVRAVPRADPRRDQVQPAVRHEPQPARR